MSFYNDLRAATENEAAAFVAVPQIVDGLNGRISKHTYLAYLTEAYHHVRHTVPLMRAAQARLDRGHDRFSAALDAYVEEETGHEQWILDDIAACGADREVARSSNPRLATELMIAFAYDYIARANPMGLFGMVYVLEGTSVLLASRGAKAVQRALNLPESAFRYLNSHGALDREHLRFFEALMNTVENQNDRDAIVHVARAIFVLFADMFRAIPHAPEAAHAA